MRWWLIERGMKIHYASDGEVVGRIYYVCIITRHSEYRIGWMTTRPLPSLTWFVRKRLYEPRIIFDPGVLHIEVRIWRVMFAAMI